MPVKSCYRCGMKRVATAHLISHPDYDHPYVLKAEPGLKPMSEGMANWRKSSGYDAAVKATQGGPCQVVSPACTGKAEHLHEPLSRGRAGGLQRAVELGGTVMACDACNGYISDNPVWGRENGWLFSNTVSGRADAAQAKEERTRRSRLR